MAELMLDFFILGIIGAMLGIFYRNCLKSRNMIFNSLYYEVFKPIAELPEDVLEAGYTPKFKDKLLSFIMFPLGYCVYCSTFWITLILCILYLSAWEVLPKWQDITIGIIAAEGVQHYVLMVTCRFILYKHPDL